MDHEFRHHLGTMLVAAAAVALLAGPAGLRSEGQKAAGKAVPIKPLKYNKDMLVKQAVVGFIAPAGFGDSPYDIDPEGRIQLHPGTGSITYNFRSGDSAVNLAGDHVEPAVTLYNLGREGSRAGSESRGLNTLACIGNRVKIWDGEGKGTMGCVIGKHGGAEHVMADFPDASVFDKLTIGDKMQIYAIGFGMELRNVAGVTSLFTSRDGRIELAVDPDANLAKLLKIR